MAEIIIEPWKKIIIHEIIEYKFEDFLRVHATGIVGEIAPPLNWALGIVFTHTVFPDSESTLQEKIKGTVHWNHLMFALKPNYEKQVFLKDTYTTVPVNDASANEILARVCEMLKQKSKYA
jgi:hypothetical protein